MLKVLIETLTYSSAALTSIIALQPNESQINKAERIANVWINCANGVVALYERSEIEKTN